MGEDYWIEQRRLVGRWTCEIALGLIRSRIDGLPDNPWVPGASFTDGLIMEALEHLEAEL
jgi:hypothetical protein